MTKRKIFVLIVAGGGGSRFGGDIPKQYLALAGKPVLRHSIDSFLDIVPSDHIKVVINPDHLGDYQNSISGLSLAPYASCGKTRKESVYNGLIYSSEIGHEDIILVHDAARPLIALEDIKNLIAAMDTADAACIVAPVSDSLCYADEHLTITNSCERENLYALQTPQAFKFGLLKQAHENAPPLKDFTDDTALVRDMGISVKLVVAKHTNFKITRKEDMALAQALLSTTQSTEFRSGTGFDVHAFDEEAKTQSIRLCGVDIPFDRKLKGHSDADVGLHALTDAILGAIGEGDIGLHFPPSDMTFKNMDSAIFLEHAMKLLKDKGGELVNADVTLICERPKIGDHRDQLRTRVADILKINVTRVNIKATTTEKLGFTGRKEGIAAQAAVSVKFQT